MSSSEHAPSLGVERLLDIKTTKALAPSQAIPAGRTVTLAERIKLEGVEGNVPPALPRQAASAAPGPRPRFVKREGHVLEPVYLGPPSRVIPADSDPTATEGEAQSHVSFAQRLAAGVAEALPPEPPKKVPSLKERIATEGVAAQLSGRAPARNTRGSD